jgi:SAM-dependent methyltransferase
MDQKPAAATDSRSQALAFWDRFYQGTTSFPLEADERLTHALNSAWNFFRCQGNCKILDLGCGRGASSIFWANTGAHVIAVDHSTSAIAELSDRCKKMGITNIEPRVRDAMTIDELGQFDYVFGSMILHHLEPFNDFVQVLNRTLKTGGRAFFYENNAASNLLIWFRDNVVGKLGVPKYGDEDESPLAPGEVDQLRKVFSVTVSYPQMVFFSLVAPYLFRDRFRASLKAIDEFLYRRDIGVRYSYRQYIMLQDPGVIPISSAGVFETTTPSLSVGAAGQNCG